MRKLLEADLAHPERCLRDIVALSTLPALWLGADTVRMAESLAAALYTTLGADFVYVCLEESPAPIAVAQVDRYRTDAALAASVGPSIIAWAREHDPEEWLELPGRAAGGILRVAAQPVGFEASLGVVAAGVAAPQAPSALQLTMLNVAATQAYTAVQNAKLVRALRDADRRKDEFLAILSHELRNPLAPIATAIQLMRLRGAEHAGARHPRAADGAPRRLVDDLLDVSRITRGKIELRSGRWSFPTPCCARWRWRSRFSRQRAPRGDRRRAAQRTAGAGRSGPAGADRVQPALQRRQVQPARSARSWCAPGATRSASCLSVKDDGMGIAPDLLERVFDMFVQQEQTIARSEGASASGSPSCAASSSSTAGRVRARSAGAGQGSEFIVELPSASAKRRRATAPAPPPRADAPPPRAGRRRQRRRGASRSPSC